MEINNNGMINSSTKILLPIREAAQAIGVGQAKLREWTIKFPDFPATTIGVKKMIIIGRIEEWLYENKAETL